MLVTYDIFAAEGPSRDLFTGPLLFVRGNHLSNTMYNNTNNTATKHNAAYHNNC